MNFDQASCIVSREIMDDHENAYFKTFFMPPTLKKFEGHIAFGLSVCVCVWVGASVNFRTVNARLLKFHMHIPHEKIVDP